MVPTFFSSTSLHLLFPVHRLLEAREPRGWALVKQQLGARRLRIGKHPNRIFVSMCMTFSQQLHNWSTSELVMMVNWRTGELVNWRTGELVNWWRWWWWWWWWWWWRPWKGSLVWQTWLDMHKQNWKVNNPDWSSFPRQMHPSTSETIPGRKNFSSVKARAVQTFAEADLGGASWLETLTPGDLSNLSSDYERLYNIALLDKKQTFWSLVSRFVQNISRHLL